MKIVFMGTPNFSVHILEQLYEADHEIIGVFTQPDRRKGRGKKLHPTPVKEFALSHDLTVHTPLSLKNTSPDEFAHHLRPDFLIVAAYGMILPKVYLDWPKIAAINIHTSLLPLYRGAAPVQRAILNKDSKTGVSLMKMDVGLDTGPVYEQIDIPIEAEDTTGTLFDKMAATGGKALIELLPKIANGLEPHEQDHSLATYAEKISKEEERINWQNDAKSIEALSRTLQPEPGMYTTLQGERLKIFQCEALIENTGQKPGCITNIEKDVFYVQTGDGLLKVISIQPAGKKQMAVTDFLKGRKNFEENLILGN